MGNSWFQFKQFRVEQAGSAMKVCTDACIQGAFTAAELSSIPPPRILDIGAGTGLLSLMLAQQTTSRIDAVELDASAAAQAAANFAASPWSNRLRLTEGDISQYESPEPYDFIISNPPFFQRDLRGPDARRTAAMHTATLDYETLLSAISRLLRKDGQFSLLLPYESFSVFHQQASAAGFQLLTRLNVRQTPAHAPFRTVGIFGQGVQRPDEELIIHNTERQYTQEFVALLQPYYLHL